MTNAVDWRYTFPIEKAEERDGRLFLIGYASGPEIDAQDDAMDPSAIHGFADQINVRAKSDRLIYRDAHAPDGVLRDLGWLEKAWVNDKNHLGVEVELDVDNPASVYLYKNITERGKKYGMSVAGEVHAKISEYVTDIGKTIRRLKDVVLTEISNTTRPAWTPSFGSVISKAIEDAEKAESLPGDSQVSDTDKELHQHVDEAPAGGNDQPEGDTESGDAATTVVEETTTTEVATTDSADTAEKAGAKLSATTRTKLLEQYESLGATLRDLGVIEGETETDDSAHKASDDETEDVAKTEGSETDPLTEALSKIDELEKSNSELSRKLQEAEGRPPTTVPPVMEKNASEEFEEVFKGLSASERLRAAMAVQTGGR